MKILIKVTDHKGMPYVNKEQFSVFDGKALKVVDACFDFAEATIDDDFDVVRMYQLRFVNVLGLLGIKTNAQLFTAWVQDDEGIHRILATVTNDNTSGAIYYKNKFYDCSVHMGPEGIQLIEKEIIFDNGKYTPPAYINITVDKH